MPPDRPCGPSARVPSHHRRRRWIARKHGEFGRLAKSCAAVIITSVRVTNTCKRVATCLQDLTGDARLSRRAHTSTAHALAWNGRGVVGVRVGEPLQYQVPRE